MLCVTVQNDDSCSRCEHSPSASETQHLLSNHLRRAFRRETWAASGNASVQAPRCTGGKSDRMGKSGVMERSARTCTARRRRLVPGQLPTLPPAVPALWLGAACQDPERRMAIDIPPWLQCGVPKIGPTCRPSVGSWDWIHYGWDVYRVPEVGGLSGEDGAITA